MITPREFEWAAGFLEGEGCFRFNAPRNPFLTASQVQREPLDRLQRLFGGQISLVYNTQMRAKGWSPCHRWTLVGSAAAGLGMSLYSMMSPRRRGQIRSMLDGWRRLKTANKHRTSCPAGHVYDLPRGVRGGRCTICNKKRLEVWQSEHAIDRTCVVCAAPFRHFQRETCSDKCRYVILSRFNLERWKAIDPAQRSAMMKGRRASRGVRSVVISSLVGIDALQQSNSAGLTSQGS